MRSTGRLLVMAAFLTALAGVQAADLTGKINLKGTPPPEKDLPLDAMCGKLHTTKPTTRFYVVGGNGELADVFVHIKEGTAGKTFTPPAKAELLDQKGCEYLPYVLGLQTGQKLLVRNSDPLLHNVHPTPTVPGNKESNQAQLPNGKDLEFSFANPELFLRYKCDVHPWMFAYVNVVPHPYYSVSAKDGTFKIANLPPGKYTIEAIHRKAGAQSQQIEVGADGKKVDFTFDVK